MMRLSGLLTSLCVGVAVLGALSIPARAAEEPGGGDTDPELQAAKAAFEDAQVLYTKEQYEEAAAKFMSAFDKKPFSSFLFNAAVAYEKARKFDLAIQEYQHYLQIDPQARDAADVKGRIDSLKAALALPSMTGTPEAEKAAQVLPAIDTKGLVIIESKPPGANVYINDTSKGVFAITPWQGSLEPKPVRLIFEAKGFKRETREIVPRSDKILELYIAMSEEHFLGWIEVVSNVPGADVFIDRQDIGAIGRTPYTGHLKPGKHKLWVQKAGYEVGSKEIDVQPGTATTHTINLDLVGYGTLRATNRANEGGKLFVDGAPVCVLPCEQQLKPGEHVLKVQKEDMEDYSGRLTVKRADVTQMDLTYSPKPSRATAWTEAVFSAGFFAGGIFLGVKGNQIKDQINNDLKDPSKLVSSKDSRKTTGKLYYLGADVCLGLGVITAALATWNFLESGPPSTATLRTVNSATPNASKVSLLPINVPGGAGMAATGRF
jgi:hypothetical protein